MVIFNSYVKLPEGTWPTPRVDGPSASPVYATWCRKHPAIQWAEEGCPAFGCTEAQPKAGKS